MTKDTARALVQELVHKFQHDPERHKHGERQTDERYILPLFRALGWDTTSSDMTAEEQINGRRADYGFYVQGVPQFYLETKRPDHRLDERSRMEQAINYAYLKGVTWAVLTDFDRLMVFNADLDEDEPTKARLLDMRVSEYVDRFDDLWLLSRPAMQERPRPIDTLATRYGKKARREPITLALFNNLADWRRELFLDIRTHTPTTDRVAVDNALQKFFDRLIFLRTLEDRQVEKPLLKEIVRNPKTNGAQAFNELLRQFRELDKIYNSNLFALHPLDELVVHNPDLVEEILNGLYKRFGVEYDFSVISADVLGAVYEQYLSFKATDPADARKTKPTKSAKRTHKRNNQGIYYTPQYVVRHIVQATLTPILARMGNDAHKITVLDPACGSGAFLIEVFDVLDRHFKMLDPTVPIRERRERILKENLFGVDLDEQAVEVTRLNLVLRAAYERQKLPMLAHIQHGNSLVEADGVAGAGLGMVWEDRFPLVMDSGGFDVVVGNPPYVRQEYLPAAFKEYAQARYTTMNGTADLYVPFVEQGFRLLKEGGRLGYILPNKWLRAKYGQNLRGYLADKVEQLIDFGDLPVFADATTYPLIFTLHKSTQPLPAPTVTQARSLPTYATESL
ncbi:MAG: Eco57I restriction-modification methylase domain-containing protein, partial [Phototrophicaceae bacterium]